MAKKFTIRKIHRYLSIFIAIQLLLWTVSGIYFAFNKIEMGQEIIETNDNGVKTYSSYPQNFSVNMLSSEEAMTIAKEKTSLNPVSVSLIEKVERGVEYRGRRLPIYKVSTDTNDGINIYVDSMTGDIAAIRSDSWRAWDLLWALHIMDYRDRDNINNLLLKIFSVLALISSITGIILFFKKTI